MWNEANFLTCHVCVSSCLQQKGKSGTSFSVLPVLFCFVLNVLQFNSESLHFSTYFPGHVDDSSSLCLKLPHL